jgi:hypothetical protein
VPVFVIGREPGLCLSSAQKIAAQTPKLLVILFFIRGANAGEPFGCVFQESPLQTRAFALGEIPSLQGLSLSLQGLSLQGLVPDTRNAGK